MIQSLVGVLLRPAHQSTKLATHLYHLRLSQRLLLYCAEIEEREAPAISLSLRVPLRRRGHRHHNCLKIYPISGKAVQTSN